MQGKGTSNPCEVRTVMIACCALYAYLQACYWNSGSVNWAKTGGNVVSVDYSSNGGTSFTTYYYLHNAKNDVVKLIDGSGTTVVSYVYDSWGKVVSTTGTLASTVGQNQSFRYRGYVIVGRMCSSDNSDTETGWYYLQSRYYDPTTCRFISADVLLSTGQGVLGHNAYAYCGNNPVCRVDSEGECWEDFIEWLRKLFRKSKSTDSTLDGKLFDSLDEAAEYGARSLQAAQGSTPDCELGYFLCSTDINGQTQYYVHDYLCVGDAASVFFVPDKAGVPTSNCKIEGIIHTHVDAARYLTDQYGNNLGCNPAIFSYADCNTAIDLGACYMLTPNGYLYKIRSNAARRYKEGDPMNGFRVTSWSI